MTTGQNPDPTTANENLCAFLILTKSLHLNIQSHFLFFFFLSLNYSIFYQVTLSCLCIFGLKPRQRDSNKIKKKKRGEHLNMGFTSTCTLRWMVEEKSAIHYNLRGGSPRPSLAVPAHDAAPCPLTYIAHLSHRQRDGAAQHSERKTFFLPHWWRAEIESNQHTCSTSDWMCKKNTSSQTSLAPCANNPSCLGDRGEI